MYLQECLSCSHKPAKIRAQDRQNTGGATLAEYEYLADGTKLRALDGGGNGYQYRGSLIYTQTAGQTGSPAITLDCAVTSAGRIVRENTADGSSTYKVQHYLRDHLGSVRAVIDGDTGTVIEASDYYQFGKRIQVTAPVSEPVEGAQHAAEPAVAPVATATSVASTSSPNRWRFSGKEGQSFLGAGIPLLDFGARMYDPTTARWTAIDPMAEKNLLTSPYLYCSGNPICIIDPFGKDEWDINKEWRIIAYRQNKDNDVINIVEKDSDGNYNQSYFINDNGEKIPLSKTFTYGTFANKHNDFFSTDLPSGIELFSFLSKETSVEYGLIVTIDNKSFIHTDNKKNGIAIVPMAMDISEKGETVTSIIHSHPNNTIPSGFNLNDTKGDKFAASAFTESHGFPVDNYVYQPKNNRLIQYTEERIIPGALFWNTIFPIY